jgi:hypothetical protein
MRNKDERSYETYEFSTAKKFLDTKKAAQKELLNK